MIKFFRWFYFAWLVSAFPIIITLAPTIGSYLFIFVVFYSFALGGVAPFFAVAVLLILLFLLITKKYKAFDFVIIMFMFLDFSVSGFVFLLDYDNYDNTVALQSLVFNSAFILIIILLKKYEKQRKIKADKNTEDGSVCLDEN